MRKSIRNGLFILLVFFGILFIFVGIDLLNEDVGSGLVGVILGLVMVIIGVKKIIKQRREKPAFKKGEENIIDNEKQVKLEIEKKKVEKEKEEKEKKEELDKRLEQEKKAEEDAKIIKYLNNFIKNFNIQHLEAIPIDFKKDIIKRAEFVTSKLKNNHKWFSSEELKHFGISDLRFGSFENIAESIRLNLLIMQTYPSLLYIKLVYPSETINYEQVFKGYYELFDLLQDNKIQNLHRLIKTKENIDIYESELIQKLICSSKNIKKKLLDDKLNKIAGSNLNEFALSVYKLFGENFEQDLEYIYNHLSEKNKINFLPMDLKKEIDSIKENKKLKKFEEELFKENANHVKKIRMEDIETMNGFEFERFCKDLFQKMNFKVATTKKSGDQGADIIMEKDGEKIAVQTKRYSKGIVGNKAVQEIVATLKYYNCNKGIVVTNSRFTKSAQDLARKNKIELIDRDKIKKLIEDNL